MFELKYKERIRPIWIVFTLKMIIHQTMSLIDVFFSVIIIQLDIWLAITKNIFQKKKDIIEKEKEDWLSRSGIF